MARSSHLLVVISSLLLLSLPFPSTATYGSGDAPEEKKFDVAVEGIVYCQSCKYDKTWSLSEAEPIPSAKVSVICKNDNDKVIFYRAYETDGHGYFYAQLEGFKLENPLSDHPLQACKVKLVSSPLENCNLLSNINDGLYGASLRYENKRLQGRNYEAMIYAAGPLAFRPAHCPSTTHY